MSEEQILSELSVDNIRKHVKHIVETMPSRLAGTPNAARMAEYSAEQLEIAGLAARVETIPGLVSFPREAELTILAPEEKVLPANTFGHSLETLPEGLSGELVYVGSGHFSDYEGKDVTGKITLSELSYSPGRHEKQRIAGLMGSTAQIMRNWGHPENAALPLGSVKPAWGNPTPETIKTEMPTIPCIGISRTAGGYLLDLLGKGPVRVRLRTNVENGWRDLQMTIGELPVAASKEFVLIGGHQDGWYGEGAPDNAAGNACMLELARVFARHRDKLRRGLVFGFWTAHETGTMVGSSWFADRNWDRVRESAVAYMMIDQPAMLGTTRWSAHSTLELREFHRGVEGRMLRNRIPEWHRAPKIGDSSFFGLGIPTFWAEGGFTPEELEATANATCGWWHHSLESTFDKVDWDWMADHIRIYAAYLWELCTVPILPFEFVSVADQFRARIGELAEAGRSVGLDTLTGHVDAFAVAARQLDHAAKHWNAKYRARGVTDDEPAELLNTCIKRLSRLLLPLASTVKGTYGHDTFSFTPQSTVIPCLYDVAKLARMAQSGPPRWQLETQLVRERNRVSDALVDARLLIEATSPRLNCCAAAANINGGRTVIG
jgi:peptidase M28-like protein